MRRFALSFVAVLALLAFAEGASAVPVPCAAPPPPDVTLATVGAAGSATFSCGGLTFSDFVAVSANNATNLDIDLVSATFDSATGYVVLNINPNMGALASQDIWLYFQVSGGIDGIDLSVGGSGSSIFELACSTAIDQNDGNNCTGGPENELAFLLNFSGLPNDSADFDTTDLVYIFKDIFKAEGGHLTSFSQSFHVASVPEPTTLLLLGSGLIGLGAWSRRKFGK